MTWLELNSNKLSNFLHDDAFCLQPLRKNLEIEVPFSSLESCKQSYLTIAKYLKNKSVPNEKKK